MLIKLIEIQRGSKFSGYSARLKEIYINPQHIISVSEEIESNEKLISEATSLGLSNKVSFSKVTIQDGTLSRSLTVVGTPSEIYKKLKNKQILRG